MAKIDEKYIVIFERKVLCTIFGPKRNQDHMIEEKPRSKGYIERRGCRSNNEKQKSKLDRTCIAGIRRKCDPRSAEMNLDE